MKYKIRRKPVTKCDVILIWRHTALRSNTNSCCNFALLNTAISELVLFAIRGAKLWFNLNVNINNIDQQGLNNNINTRVTRGLGSYIIETE